MHKSFADWYELLSVKKNGEMLPLRWKAVEAVAQEIQLKEIIEVIRIFYSKPAAEQSKEKIREAARTADSSFVTEGSDIELSILAAGILAKVIEKGPSTEADIASLGLSCMEVQGLRKRPRLQVIIDEATLYRANESVRVRELNTDPVPMLDHTSFLPSFKKEAEAISDNTTLWAATENQFRRLLALHQQHTKSINAAFNTIISRQREQSDILWWLFSEHTLDKEPFSKLTVPQACFRGAKDLADLTQQVPGPFAAPAFLHRMIRLVKKTSQSTVSLTNALADSSLEWKQAWAGSLKLNGLHDICPLLFALVKSVEVGGSNGWHDAFEHKTGLSRNLELPPPQFATQVYDEALFLRSLNG